jgi:hypothetical protein
MLQTFPKEIILPTVLANNSKMIFEDDHIQAFAGDYGSYDVLVTFSDMLFSADGSNFAAKKIIHAERLSHLAFVAKSRNWFPKESIYAAISCSSSFLDTTDRHVSTYGSSMGAYAAIKFSRALKARTVLAAAPQWSIRPQDVAKFDRRFVGYATDQSGGDAITKDDVSGQVFIFADPKEGADINNANKIMEVCKTAAHIKTHYSSHGAAVFLKGQPQLIAVMNACKHGDSNVVQQITSLGRKNNPDRAAQILSCAADTRPLTTIAIIESLVKEATPEATLDVFFRIGRALVGRNKLGLAEQYLEEAHKVAPSDIRPMLFIARAKQIQRDYAAEIDWRRRIVALLPRQDWLRQGLQDAEERARRSGASVS